MNGDWNFRVDARNEGMAQRWHSPLTADDEWQALSIPTFWEFHGIDSDAGIGWYRRTFHLTEPQCKPKLGICLAGIDCHASVWLNGQPVTPDSPIPQRFAARVSDHLRPGENLLALRVADRGRPGGMLTSAWLDDAGDSKTLLRNATAGNNARPSADWVRDAVIYEAYLRSASPTGTFRGLQARLDDLRRLGVTVLWLMPIHPIGARHRKGSLGSPYAVRDYLDVNLEFGTLEDFKALVDAAHQRGMRLILDLVLNHTAWDCPLTSAHPHWYAHDEHGAIRAPFDDWSDVAQLDYAHAEPTSYMIDMMTHWVREIGIDGYRCDVAGLVPDHVWNQARPQLDAIKPVLMLAEDDQPHQHVHAFDLTYDWFTYRLLGRLPIGTLTATDVETLLQNERFDFPRHSIRLRFSSNHDLCAWHKPGATRYGGPATLTAAALTFALPGVPLIYTGQEIGNTTALPLFERAILDWRHAALDHHFAVYAALCRLRRERESLRTGTLRFVASGDERILGVLRAAANESTLFLINLSSATLETTVPIANWSATRTLLGLTRPAGQPSRRLVILPPYGVWIGTSQ